MPVNAKPHGKNITEGGFEGEAKNNDFEIGSDQDPGRAALQKMQASNASAAGGAGPQQADISDDSQYGALNNEEAT